LHCCFSHYYHDGADSDKHHSVCSANYETTNKFAGDKYRFCNNETDYNRNDHKSYHDGNRGDDDICCYDCGGAKDNIAKLDRDRSNYYSSARAVSTLLLPLLLGHDVIAADVIVHRVWRRVSSRRGAVCR